MALTLISTHTASADASIDITAGITSTYDSYEFHMVNMHPATNAAKFSFQVNVADASGFNEEMTTTTWMAYHGEDNSYGAIAYSTGDDQPAGTAYQTLCPTTSDDADASMSGVLTLYAPSSTTYVKHFTARTNDYSSNGPLMYDFHAAGYINVTAAIDEISFKFHTGNIDDGTIKMFGVS
jgi:hypothetical protein